MRACFTRFASIVVVLVALVQIPTPSSTAEIAGDPSFLRTWERLDKPVADRQVDRTWIWGPGPFSRAFTERYDEGPLGRRLVQYFDKTRMEITDPARDPNTDWYVTNGLLVVELVTGRRQVGDNTFEAFAPAEVNVAGDPDDTAGPTYASIGSVLDDAPFASGSTLTYRLRRDGTVDNDPTLAVYGATASTLVDVPGLKHRVASVFWDFMTSEGTVYEDGWYEQNTLFPNPYYGTGYPIAEAYWTTVKVGGTSRDVLLQCFERRCLTWTPENPDGWQVEAGNVGQHYFRWRHPAESPTEYEPAGVLGSPFDRASDFMLLSGIAVGPNNEVAVADASSTRRYIQIFDAQGFLLARLTDPTPLPEDAQSFWPSTVAFDGQGRIYAADPHDGCVQIFSPDGTFVTDWPARIGAPSTRTDLAVDPTGLVHVLNQTDNLLLTYEGDGREIRRIGVSGPEEQRLLMPAGIGVDNEGGIYVADSGNERVVKLGPDGAFEWSDAIDLGSGDRLHPIDVAVDEQGRIIVASSLNDRIVVLDQSRTVIDVWESVPSAGHDQRLLPTSLAVARDGTVWVASQDLRRVYKLAVDGELLDWFIAPEHGVLARPVGMAVAASGNLLVVDQFLCRVVEFDDGGVIASDWAFDGVGERGLTAPSDIAVGPDGSVYVADGGNHRIVKYATDTHAYLTEWSVETGDPEAPWDPNAVAVAGDGRVVVAAWNWLGVFTSNGQLLRSIDIPLPPGGSSFAIYSIAFHGNTMYALDNFNDRLLIMDIEGRVHDIWTPDDWPRDDPLTGWHNNLQDVAVAADGSVFIAAGGADVVIKLTPDGQYQTRIGRGVSGSRPGELWSAQEIAVDGRGNVIVADFTERLQRFAPSP